MFRVASVRWCGAMVAIALLAFAGTAQARATLTSFEDHQILSGTTALPECLPADLEGVVSGTEDVYGTIVDTGTTVHAHITGTLKYRVDFPDGSYVIGESTEHFGFTSQGDTPFVSTTTGREPRTLYDAAGNVIGTAMLHFHGHITVFDANGDGQFADDEIVTNYDQFFWTCGTGPPTRG